ncbi:MAG: DUF6261 family protein [Microbacter sp.]
MNTINKQIPFQRFHKSEYRNVVKEVIAVVSAYPTQANMVKNWIDRLKAMEQQMDQLEVPRRKHPDTAELVKTRNKSLDLIRAIIAQVKSLKRVNLETQATDITLLDAFISQFLQPIVRTDWSNRTFNLDKMFAALSLDTNLQAAIANLNLSLLFDELSGLANSQKTIRENRSASIRQQKKVDTLAIRSKATAVIRELFAAIDLAQIEHSEVDFTEMVNGINQCLNYYISQAKTRKTLYEKKSKEQRTVNEPKSPTKVAQVVN